jgi:hypothetical protein
MLEARGEVVEVIEKEKAASVPDLTLHLTLHLTLGLHLVKLSREGSARFRERT